MEEEKQYCDYIIYVDESGDHSLESIDPNYPIFVLAFCIFKKTDYAQIITPAIQAFKFKYFGHDMVILHEEKIRKAKDDFKILVNAELRQSFCNDLSQLMEQSPFTIIAVAINKIKHKEKYITPDHPYHLALYFALERIRRFLAYSGFNTKHFIFESRGRKEDAELELEFRRLCKGLPFDLIFADKKVNSSGLQLADLVARPIGRHLLNPIQENRAYRILERKFHVDSLGRKEGVGLKYFP